MCWLVRGRWGTDSSYSTSAWAAPSVHSERWMQYPRRRPIASSIMGFEDKVEQSLARPCREIDGQADIRTHLIRRPARDIIPPLVDIRFLLSALILYGCHVAATSLVHRNSVPSTQMRCMIPAQRRGKAKIGFFSPPCLGNFLGPGLEPGPFRRAHQ